MRDILLILAFLVPLNAYSNNMQDAVDDCKKDAIKRTPISNTATKEEVEQAQELRRQALAGCESVSDSSHAAEDEYDQAKSEESKASAESQLAEMQDYEDVDALKNGIQDNFKFMALANITYQYGLVSKGGAGGGRSAENALRSQVAMNASDVLKDYLNKQYNYYSGMGNSLNKTLHDQKKYMLSGVADREKAAEQYKYLKKDANEFYQVSACSSYELLPMLVKQYNADQEFSDRIQEVADEAKLYMDLGIGFMTSGIVLLGIAIGMYIAGYALIATVIGAPFGAIKITIGGVMTGLGIGLVASGAAMFILTVDAPHDRSVDLDKDAVRYNRPNYDPLTNNKNKTNDVYVKLNNEIPKFKMKVNNVHDFLDLNNFVAQERRLVNNKYDHINGLINSVYAGGGSDMSDKDGCYNQNYNQCDQISVSRDGDLWKISGFDQNDKDKEQLKKLIALYFPKNRNSTV